MSSFIDGYALFLLFISLALFVRRYMTQNPPVYPYLIIALTCLAANLLNQNGGLTAVVLLTGASFSFLGCLFYPEWRHMSQNAAERAADNQKS